MGAPIVRLADGAWAMPDSQGVWIGLLEGHIDTGWRSHLELIPAAAQEAVVRAVNLGTGFATDRLSLHALGDGVRIELCGGHRALLDDLGAARLQILCTRRPPLAAARPHGPQVPNPLALPVGSARGALRVFDTPVLGDDVRLTGLSAAAGATAVLQLRSDRGAFALPVPALPLLLAAAEAGCDGTVVQLHLVERSGRYTVVELDAERTGRSAADAQWLIPALSRQTDDDVWSSSG